MKWMPRGSRGNIFGATRPKDGYYWTEVASIGHLRYGPDWSNVVPWQEFVNEAESGSLPAVSWVTADQFNSEHPPSRCPRGRGR